MPDRLMSQNCPEVPILSGQSSLCRVQGTYEIINYNAAFASSYAVSVAPSGAGVINSFNTGNGLISVTWSAGITLPCSLVVSLTGACSGADTLYMMPCCDPSGQVLISPSIAQLPGAVYNQTSGEWTITNQTIRIQGTLQVKQPLNLISCTFNMGPGSRIDVLQDMPSGTIGALVLSGSSLQADPACNVMWEGVRLFENTQIKTELSGTNPVNLSRAQNAIGFYGSASYHFRASQTNLWNNFRGIYARKKNGAQNILLTRTAASGNLNIQGGNNTLPANYGNGQLPLPAANTCYVGIELINCGTFELDGSQGRNNLSNFSYGVLLYDSDFSMNTSTISNVQSSVNYPSSLNTSACIYAYRSSNTLTRSIQLFPLSTAPGLLNDFQNSNRGIYISGNYELNAQKNQFTTIAQEGVLVQRARNGTLIEIKNLNVFSNCNKGVSIQNCTKANIHIINNTFNSTAAYGTGSFDNVAMYLNGKSPELDYQIIGNSISGYRIGIYAINLARFSIGMNAIRYNTIEFNRTLSALPSPTSNYMGIWLDKQEKPNVYNNTISYTQSPITFSSSGRLRGFNMKDCSSMNIALNNLNNLGISMRFVGDNRPSVLQCNTMNACNKGVFCDNAAISNQGQVGEPWDNKWMNFGGNLRVYGTLLPNVSSIFWYYKTNNSDFNPQSLPVTLWLNNVQDNGISPCDNIADPPDDDDTHTDRIVALLQSILIDSTCIPQDSLDYRFRMRLFAYEILEENDSLRAALPEFMSFYAENLNTTLGRICRAENAIENLDYQNAIVELNASNCVETASQILHYTLDNIADYDLAGEGVKEELPVEVLEQLESIAWLPASIYGRGVFYARAILELEVDDIDIGLRVMQHSASDYPEVKKAHCFDLLGRPLVCPELNQPGILRRKTANGNYIIYKYQ